MGLLPQNDRSACSILCNKMHALAHFGVPSEGAITLPGELILENIAH